MSRYHFIEKEPVDKGWSGDKKYRAADANGESYLLRVSPLDQRERKAREFEIMREIESKGISMCRALEFGEGYEGVYSVQTWINGRDAEEAVPHLSREKQYALGYESGEILKKIHSIPAPENQPAWDERFNAKMDRKIALHRQCPVQYAGAEHFIRYIEENPDVLKNRPQSFQHGDYHTGNMMIGSDGELFVIDFDRDDYGDPWEEFNRIVWCAQDAPEMARGMVDGYFDGTVPELFWRLLLLYISSNTLGSLPWAIPYGMEQVKIMTDQWADIRRWYEDFRRIIPSWYRKEE